MSAGYRIERLRLPSRLEGPEAVKFGSGTPGHDREWHRSLQ